MSNLPDGKVILKFNKSVLVQKKSSLVYSKFILNLYVVDELNNWTRNHSNDFKLNIVYLVQSN